MNPTRSALFLLLLFCAARAHADADDWQPPVPMPGQYDWRLILGLGFDF